MTPRPLILNALSMNAVSHLQQGLWVRDDTRQREYHHLAPWPQLAELLERGGFDTLFLADVVGLYDTYGGGPDTALREALQVPVNDPAMLIPAMATVTEHLGFAFTSSVLQTPPFTFARQVSTLDHLTGGRLAWNIVTSPLRQRSAQPRIRKPPTPTTPATTVLTSTSRSSTSRGRAAGRTAPSSSTAMRGCTPIQPRCTPSTTHGDFCDLAGPHLCEPSPQRTPMLFQADASDRGREFAAKHAEGVFVVVSRRSLPSVVADIRARAVRTEAEARAKADEYSAQLSIEAGLAHLSGMVGTDLSVVDPDRPLDDLHTNAVQSIVNGL